MNLDFSNKYINKDDLDNIAFQIFYNLPSCYNHFHHLGISYTLENKIKIKNIEKNSVKYKKLVRRIKQVRETANLWEKGYNTNVHLPLSDILEDIQDCDGDAGRIGYLFEYFLDCLKKNGNKINCINHENTIKYILNKSNSPIRHKDKFKEFAENFNTKCCGLKCEGSSASLSFYETDKNNIVKKNIINPKAKIFPLYNPEIFWTLYYRCKEKKKKVKINFVKKNIYGTKKIDDMLANVSFIIEDRHKKENI